MVDFTARYSVAGYRGVAFYLKGYSKKYERSQYWDDHVGGFVDSDEFDEVDDESQVIAVMVGDDREHIVDVEDLTVLGELDYCAECGQVGCTHDGRERE